MSGETLKIIRESVNDMFVSVRSRVNPEIMEYERTGHGNERAARPHCGSMAAVFTENAPRRHWLASNIYFCSRRPAGAAEVVKHASGTLWSRDPRAGVTASRQVVRTRLVIPNAITGDMGGTSFDVSLIAGGQRNCGTPAMINTYTVAGAEYRHHLDRRPAAESIAWIDEGGGVGSAAESAGRQPAGLLTGRGLEHTRSARRNHCNHFILGYVDPESFARRRLLRLDVTISEGKHMSQHDPLRVRSE